MAKNHTDDCTDEGGTRPWMVEGRAMQDDSMDGIGRVESGTETAQLSRATHGAVAEEHGSMLIHFRVFLCDSVVIN